MVSPLINLNTVGVSTSKLGTPGLSHIGFRCGLTAAGDGDGAAAADSPFVENRGVHADLDLVVPGGSADGSSEILRLALNNTLLPIGPVLGKMTKT
jgi:hypothetical protein